VSALTQQTQPSISHKLRLAVFKFASCDGCQLSLLDCEDELVSIAAAVEIAYFLEATSKVELGPYDVALVEGSITTPHDARRIQEVRRQSKFLVTIGACATAGGIQALRNWADHADFLRCVYARPDYIDTLATSTAIADHVTVDFELRGCPINRHQLVEVLQSLLAGRRPQTPTHSVCLDCKRRGTVCVTVARGIPCLGPVTQAGCGAICPSYDRGCYGCFGPAAQPNCDSLADHLMSQGTASATLVPLLRNYNAAAPAFRAESDRLQMLANSIASPAPSPRTGP
jgi:sulfhydrogenase subunit delta